MKILSIALSLLSTLSFLACSSTEEEKKVDLQKIKENRQGLDYGAKNQELFANLDTLLKEWGEAQKSRDPGNVHAKENSLREAARSQFTALTKALEGSNPTEQAIAAAALGFSDDIRALQYLIDALYKGDPLVRRNAAMGIGHIGSDQTPMEPVLKRLAEEPDDNTRGMIVFAIARIVTKDKDYGTLPQLLKCLKDSSDKVRNHALIALAKVGDEESAKAIIATTLNDKDASIRYNSIRTLTKIGSQEAVVPLIRRIKDPVEPVRVMAVISLQTLTGKEFGLDYKEWADWAGITEETVKK